MGLSEFVNRQRPFHIISPEATTVKRLSAWKSIYFSPRSSIAKTSRWQERRGEHRTHIDTQSESEERESIRDKLISKITYTGALSVRTYPLNAQFPHTRYLGGEHCRSFVSDLEVKI